MQLRIDSEEPLERVLQVVGALYGVRLTVDRAAAADLPDEGDAGLTMPRH